MMVTNKGDDLKITLQESNIQKVRVFTTDINTFIEKTPSDNVVNISAEELINSGLKSGVIAYVCAKSSADSGFEDGKFDTTSVEYTDIYYKDINESFSNAEDEVAKEYSDKLEALKKDLLTKINNKAEQNDLSNEVGERKKALAEFQESAQQLVDVLFNSLGGAVNTKAENKDLTDETTERKTKDEELQRQLTDLQDSTSSINSKLNSKAEQTNLANEVSDRKKADEDLQNKISSLQNKVQTDIEDKLYSKIDRSDLEKEASTKAEKAELTKEVSERKANDTQIQNYVDSYINNIMFYAASDQSFDDFLSSHNLKKFYAYSTSKDGRENFSTAIFKTAKYIGVCIAPSNSIGTADYAKYNWKVITNKNKIKHTCFMRLGDYIGTNGDTITLDKQTMVAYTFGDSICRLQLVNAGTYTVNDKFFSKEIGYHSYKKIYKVAQVNTQYKANFTGIYYDLSNDVDYTVPYYYPTEGDKTLAIHTIEALSGNSNLAPYTYLKLDEKNIKDRFNRGLNVMFIRGIGNPKVLSSRFFDTYSKGEINKLTDFFKGQEASAFDDCILIILGYDALSVDSNFLNVLKQYGYGGDKRLYEVLGARTPFVFIGQKGIPEGYAYYTMDYEKIKANVKFGILEENENSNEKNIFFNK